MTFGSDFNLILFTNDPDLATQADAAGINRIGLDLETIGKTSRQNAAVSWISHHTLEELAHIRDTLVHADLFVRVNQMHSGSRDEIQQVLDVGAEVLMLPMFKTLGEVSQFLEWVDGRARTVLLAETMEAVAQLPEIVSLPGVEEIHLGLNDLGISMGLTCPYRLLVHPILEQACETLAASGKRYGVGRIGRACDNDLPVPSDLIYAMFPRLGASAAIISRVFFGNPAVRPDLAWEIHRMRTRLDELAALPPTGMEQYHRRLLACVEALCPAESAPQDALQGHPVKAT